LLNFSAIFYSILLAGSLARVVVGFDLH